MGDLQVFHSLWGNFIAVAAAVDSPHKKNSKNTIFTGENFKS